MRQCIHVGCVRASPELCVTRIYNWSFGSFGFLTQHKNSYNFLGTEQVIKMHLVSQRSCDLF